ncbi:MAG: hypothetical protein H7240_06170 [Glaciimonas sp.]|nr:hypothetical protein [Glaciimonas sp.]
MTTLSTSRFYRAKTALRQRGQNMSEYIIIASLIVVVSIGVFGIFGLMTRHQVASMALEIPGNKKC